MTLDSLYFQQGPTNFAVCPFSWQRGEMSDFDDESAVGSLHWRDLYEMDLPKAIRAILSLAAVSVAATWTPLEWRDSVAGVQPMTGIVLWADNGRNATDAVALEFSYMSFAAVSPADGVWNWKPVDSLLDKVASRKHQAILRFRYEYVAEKTTVPAWIQAKPGYQETVGKSEGQDTWFSDWRSTDLMRFTLDFHTAFAKRYQDDPRLAFVQVGFGLWAEYHIYDGPMVLGRTFPDRAFQTNFVRHLDTTYTRLPWSISIDAANDWAPFDSVPALKNLGFGLFDDSFLHQTHDAENRPNWLYFGETRWKRRPAGGEFSYYSDFDQQHVLDSAGIYGRTFESQASRYGISYMIGNDQLGFHTVGRVAQASRACGYRFKAVEWAASKDSFRLGLTNSGAAPLYRDAYAVVGSDTSKVSLKGIGAGDTIRLLFARRDASVPRPSIACGHCVAGQKIGLDANLAGEGAKVRVRRSTESFQWMHGASGWLYTGAMERMVSVFTLDGRSVWRGVLQGNDGIWKRLPVDGANRILRFVEEPVDFVAASVGGPRAE